MIFLLFGCSFDNWFHYNQHCFFTNWVIILQLTLIINTNDDDYDFRVAILILFFGFFSGFVWILLWMFEVDDEDEEDVDWRRWRNVKKLGVGVHCKIKYIYLI